MRDEFFDAYLQLGEDCTGFPDFWHILVVIEIVCTVIRKMRKACKAVMDMARLEWKAFYVELFRPEGEMRLGIERVVPTISTSKISASETPAVVIRPETGFLSRSRIPGK